MAEASPVQALQEEATCPICLDFYTDPVTTKCGHNFCRSCISECSEGAGTALPCPQCREPCPQGELRANRQLQNMVQSVKKLSVQQERPPGEGLCEEHEEKLKLFCEEDEKLICVICRESSDHEQHKVRPVKEAAQKYKRELQASLKPLREQLGAIRQRKLKEEAESRTLRTKLETERRKIETEFEELRQTLKEQERELLRRIEEMEKKIRTVEDLKIAKLTAEMSSLEELLREIEKKCEQPPGELLKDIRSTLSRCEQVIIPNPTLEQIKKNYKGDGGYPLFRWLITPFRNTSSAAEERFNAAHVRTRNVIERSFGLLKSRFRVLDKSGGSLLYSPAKTSKIIVVCCMLHNICIRKKIPLLDDQAPPPRLLNFNTFAPTTEEMPAPDAKAVRARIVHHFQQ